MHNNMLLSLAMSIIPMLAIGFVAVLLIYKGYIKVRSRFNATVNCWFCNHNTKVPYLEANSWTCPACEQYNGFTKDGDYNREIYEQLDCSGASQKRFSSGQSTFGAMPASNGLCEGCNEAQRLKVEKLAQFEPKNESRFDEELKVYQAQLEQQYRLCTSCDRHLNKVLREKKKMVLGSKFLDFIIKGSENLKQPYLKQIDHSLRETKKSYLRFLITVFTLINVCCLVTALPGLNKEHLTHMLGDSMGELLFKMASHFIALSKVLLSYLELLTNQPLVVKCLLFAKTIFMMLMYSLGLKVHSTNFNTLFTGMYPFAALCLSFMINVSDAFRLTRFTGLLVTWSLFAGGLIQQHPLLMLLASLITLILTVTTKAEPSPKFHDITANSFHKMYSEECLSDDDSISMLSQQINGSCVSMRSLGSNKSFSRQSPMSQTSMATRLTKSPLTSSAFNLNQMPKSQISPNSSFRSYAGEENRTMQSVFATPMTTPAARQGLFSSNLELNSHKRMGSLHNFNSSMTNASLLNNSFVEPRNQSTFLNQTQGHDLSFATAANSSAAYERSDRTFVQPSNHITSGIYSPFSASTSAVYQHTQSPMPARNLLSPARFSTHNLAASNTSWLSGGYFNQRQSMAELPRSGLLLQTTGPLTPMEEGLSRASSHSSGFESQNGRPHNMSRENSLCAEFNDYRQQTLTRENLNSFQPIDSPQLGAFSPRPSVLSNPSLNTNSNMSHLHADVWKQTAFARRPIGQANMGFSRLSTADSFNLRKINEELPSLNNGELFQQRKEGQTIS